MPPPPPLREVARLRTERGNRHQGETPEPGQGRQGKARGIAPG